jgi:hypothetical protein
MKNHDKRAQELLDLVIAASCEAKYLRIKHGLNVKVEQALDDAAGLLRVMTADIEKEEQARPSVFRKLGLR